MASVKILEKPNKLKTVKSANFPILSIDKSKRSTTIQQVLPFRIKFTNIGIPGYGPGNGAPIGIAIIGINNYIL